MAAQPGHNIIPTGLHAAHFNRDIATLDTVRHGAQAQQFDAVTSAARLQSLKYLQQQRMRLFQQENHALHARHSYRP